MALEQKEKISIVQTIRGSKKLLSTFKFAEKMDCDLITHAPSHMYVLDLRDDEFLSI